MSALHARRQVVMSDANVLLVEDHMDASVTLQLMLRQMGIRNIFTASDGNEALKLYGQAGGKIDLILCDWNMPNMSGIQLLKQIRRKRSDLPFIMITARGDRNSIEEARTALVSSYILKPFSLEEMRKKISGVIPFA